MFYREHVRKSLKKRSKLVSEKIPVLMAEGKTQKQAVGEAEGMADEGRLRPGGIYVRAKRG